MDEAIGLAIVPVQRGFGTHPKGILAVNVKRSYLVAGQAIRVFGIMPVMPPQPVSPIPAVEPGKTADPQRPRLILVQSGDRLNVEAIVIVGIGPIVTKPVGAGGP